MSDTGLGDLSPEEIQLLMQLLQGRQAPGAFGGAFGPSMDQTGMDLAGYSPVDIPQLTPKGKVDPYDLTQAQQRLNLGQDIYGSFDDPMLGALGGAGAFGPDAFQPTYDYGEPLNLVGRKTAQQYLDRGGYRGYIADAIMNQGMGPDEAAQSAMDLAMRTDASKITDPKQKALIESLQKSLPQAASSGNQVTLPSGGGKGDLPGGRQPVTAYNFKEVNDFATNLFEGIAKDPTFAYQDQATGNYYAKTPEQAMQKTEAMKAFDKAGIPYITDTYGDTGYIDKATAAATGRNTEEQQAAEQDYLTQMQQLQAEHDAGTQRQLAARQGMDTLREMEQKRLADPNRFFGAMQGPPAPGQPGGPTLPSFPRGQQSTVQVPPVAYAQGLNQNQVQGPSPDFKVPQLRIQEGSHLPGPLRGSWVDDVYNYLGPNPTEDQAAPATPEVTKHVGTPTPNTQPLFYVDQNGNIVSPPDVGGNPSTAAKKARQTGAGLTRRPASQGDMATLQAQYDRENQASSDYSKRRWDLAGRDPSLDRFAAFVRANELQKAGRTPTRDALMQRQLALRAMGFGQ